MRRCFKIRIAIAHVIPAKAGIQRLKDICHGYIKGLYDETDKITGFQLSLE
jgi:hypothetical protein